MTLKEAKRIVGGISFPSKLKGTAAASSLHPGACVTGTLLSRNEKSVCFKCFGKKGRFSFPAVQQSLWNRTEIVKRLDPINGFKNWADWCDAWALLINHYSPTHFRHFMVGDIQSHSHLLAINAVCQRTPTTKHWIPSLDWNKFGGEAYRPHNAVIRWTWPRVNQRHTRGQSPQGSKAIVISAMDYVPTGYFPCPATFSHAADLKTCRAHNCTKCWKPGNIAYKEH